MAARTLVDRCVEGEADAWRELHRELYPVVAAFLRRMGVPRAEIDDASQEVFERVFRHLASFEGRADIKTWVYRLCVTQVGRLRRQHWFRDTLQRLRRPAGGEPRELPVLPTLGEVDMEQRIAAALSAMKGLHREVLVLYELEGLPGEEIARILDCPEATVWRRLHYARQEFSALVRGREVLV